MPVKNQHLILLAILALAVFVRVAVAFYLGDSVPPGKDEQSYSELAWRLATGHGYSFDRPWYPFAPADAPTAHWSFLYTAFVAAVYAVAGYHPLAARLIQAVLTGLLLPWLTYRLAQRAMGDRGQEPGVRSQGSGVRGYGTSYIVHRTFHIPLLAALLAAVYAYFVLYGAMVQTEALYICALLWSLERALALDERLRSPLRLRSSGDLGLSLSLSLTFGLSLGIATLLRQSILPWVVVLFAWLLWWAVRGSVGPTGVLRKDRPQRGGRKVAASPLPSQAACVPRSGREGRGVGDNSSNSCNSWQTAVASLFIAGLILLAGIAPFTVRNYRAYGDFLLLNSNAGYAMYSAQHPDHGTSFREYWAAPLPADIDPATMNEATWDKALMRRGIGFVLADPGRYLLLSLSRVRDHIEFWPTADSSLLFNVGRVASIGVFLPFMLYGLWLEVQAKVQAKGGRFSASALTLTLAFVLFYSALHIATWAMSRYRLPADAVLLIFAAVGIADLVGRATGVRRQGAGRPQVG